MRCWRAVKLCIYMSVYIICLDTQWSGDSALMMASMKGRTKVVSLLLEAEANTDLQNKVECRGKFDQVVCRSICWEVWNEVLGRM